MCGSRQTLSAAMLALVAACGSGLHYGAGNQPVGTTGTLQVTLAGAPACAASAVNATVQKVRVHLSASALDGDSGWIEVVPSPAGRQNLAALVNGNTARIGEAGVSPGTYAQARLVLQPTASGSTTNSIVASGAELALDTSGLPSGGVALPTSVAVAAGQTSELVIVVDACRSVVPRPGGLALLDPVARAYERAGSGSVKGSVDAPAAAAGTVVSAQKGGAVLSATTADASGNFVLGPLAAAASPIDVVVTTPGRSHLVVADVPVTAAVTTTVAGTALVAPASSTHTVSGTVAPTTARSRVRAVQMAGAGVIETGITVPNYGSGTWSLALASLATQRAQWSAASATPLSFVAQSATAGRYTIEATAAGYAPQSSAIDVSASDQSRSFGLVP